MAVVHPSSIIEDGAELADDVVVGPFCYVGPKAKIGPGTHLMSHVTVLGRTTIGARNRIFMGASIGCEPQDKKYAGEDTILIVGDDNVIRENCTMSIGTTQDEGITTVGSRNLFMANAHVAHDCKVGDDVILANNVALAGHVTVGDFAIVGGQTGVHQFVRIGTHAMVGGASAALRDVPPYVICSGNPAAPHGLNSVGLRRSGFTAEQLSCVKECYRAIYREGNLIADAGREMQEILDKAPEDCKEAVRTMMEFVMNSPRGIIR